MINNFLNTLRDIQVSHYNNECDIRMPRSIEEAKEFAAQERWLKTEPSMRLGTITVVSGVKEDKKIKSNCMIM